MNKTTLLIILFLQFHIFWCIKDFDNLEICAAYKIYPEEGNYEGNGVPSTENHPSSRYFVHATYNKNKNLLWIFGGEGVGRIYTLEYARGLLNDFWRYNLTSNEWTWVSGSQYVNERSYFVEQGEPHPDNHPGSRYGGCLWEDEDGTIWLFGGYGYGVDDGIPKTENQDRGALGDLWKFDGTHWTFVTGTTEFDAPGEYRGLKTPHPDAYPPARANAVCWKDKNGHFWVHGGAAEIDDSKFGSKIYADTWRFDGEYWAHWNGPNTTNVEPVHGDYRSFSQDYHPGSRAMHTVTQTRDAIYIIGGIGRNNNYSDIWKFETEKGWALWAGEPTTTPIHPGEIRVPSENNIIGSRFGPNAVVDDDENLWIIGGGDFVWEKENGHVITIFGDVWIYNQTYFVWVAGDAINRNLLDTYGTGPDQLSSSNILGSSGGGFSFIDQNGFINIFGIYGIGNDTEKSGELNNYWKIAYGYDCFGKSVCRNSVEEVCSGRGRCVAPNTCKCNPGFGGAECESTVSCPTALITSSRFNFDASKILLEFNVPLNTQYTPYCSSLFEDSWKLGSNPKCEYTSSTVLTITLDNHLLAGENLTLNANELKDGVCGFFVESQTVTVLPPVGAQNPVAVLNAPLIVGGCQNLKLESTSYGYGALKYSWKHIDDSGHQFSWDVAYLLGNLSDTTTTAEIPAHLLQTGIYKFELTVTDVFGQSDVTTILVEKSTDDQIPMVVIQGEHSRVVKRQSGFFIEASATFACEPVTGKRLSFQWSSEPAIELGPSKNSPILYVAPYSLTIGEVYKFQLKVAVIDTNNHQEISSSTVSVNVTAESSNLIAIISGDSRTVPATSTLVVDASNSYDPDTPTSILTYQWTCCKKIGDLCDANQCLEIFDDLTNFAESKYSKTPTSPFPAGTYKFIVTVQQDVRVAQAETEITIKPEPIPVVSIKSSSIGIHNSRRPLLLTAFVQSEFTDLIYQWTVTKGNLNLTDKNVAPFGTDKLQLYIEGSKITDTQVAFEFSATSKSSQVSGSAQISIDINLAPFGGNLISNIQQARSLQDTITLSTSGWIDVSEDLPLRYMFYQVIESPNGETIDQPLHSFPQTKSEFSFIAPVVEQDEMITYKVVAFDNKNAGASITTTVEILAFQKESNETNEDVAEKLINENMQFLVNEGNIDKIIRYIDNVAEILRLSPGSDSIEKRIALKEKLVELYGEVFKSNINFINGDMRTSVISTLMKLIGNPKEITKESASESQDLLNLIFHTDSETSIHAVESLPNEIGQQSISAISNLIEATGIESNQTQQISKTISSIGRLVLLDKPGGTKAEFDSSQIRLVQAREYSHEVIGKSVKNDDSEISLPNGVFDNLDPSMINVVDVRLLKWNNNPHANIETDTNITSPVISADILNEFGIEITIENLQNPIQIKIPSKLAKTGQFECRFLNTTSLKWVQIGLEKVVDGEYTICTTTHLSDFATFIASDPPQEGFNPHILWLLLLLIPGAAVIGTVTALFVVLYKKRKKLKTIPKESQFESLNDSNAELNDSGVELLDVTTQQPDSEPTTTETKPVHADEELPDIPTL